MRRLPVELEAEIVEYLAPRELAAVSRTAKGFQQLVTHLLYRHIVFHARSAKDHLRVERFFVTLIAHADDIAPFVQHLDFDWNAQLDFKLQTASLESLLMQTLPHLTSLTYLAVGPGSNLKIGHPLTVPTLREFHFAATGALNARFLSHHPHLVRLSLGTHSSAPHVIDSKRNHLPQGLEYLRVSSATSALDVLGRHPQGREAKLTRLDLRVVTWWDKYDFLEVMQLLRERFFTVSCINVFGSWAKDFMADTSTVTCIVGHVTRADVPFSELVNIEFQLPELLVGVARLFPNVRTLDILDSEARFADCPFYIETSLASFKERLPRGKDANMTRVDLGASSAQDSDERLEILTLLRDRYPTLSWIKIYGRFARDVLEDPHAPPIDHVARRRGVQSSLRCR